MLSVIVLAEREGERLPAVLAVLTSAAVEGLVREVTIVGGGPRALLDALRDDTGADLADRVEAAISAARSDQLLVAAAGFRPRGVWIEQLAAALRGGAREAVIAGAATGMFKRAPYAVLIPRAKAAGLAKPDLQHLRRALGRGAARLG